MSKSTKNPAFIAAFNPIARACLPFFDTERGYISDLVHDAEYAADMPAMSARYITVRSMGTWLHDTYEKALEHLTTNNDLAIVRVSRGDFDTFKADVVHIAPPKQDRVEDAVREWYGKRCSEFEAGCPTCEAWQQFDVMRGV